MTIEGRILTGVAILLCSPLYLHAGSYPAPRTVPRDQPAAEILAEIVICKQPKRYIGWPTITRAANGDLVVAFSGDRDWHVDPWGKIFTVRSTDSGESWDDPVMVIDTPLDDRDASITTLEDGTLLLAFGATLNFTDRKNPRYAPYRDHAASLTPAVRKKWLGPWLSFSRDHGHTWEPFARAPTRTPHGPAQLKDGRLIFVQPAITQSRDQGKTWTQVKTFEKDPATWKSRFSFLSEQHAVQAADGSIIALSRYAHKDDIELRQVRSDDGGETWTQPRKTGMRGYPAHLLRLENGWLLASYGRRIPPMGERASVSQDNGRTWRVQDEIVLGNATPQNAGHLGYPSSTQLPDGSIWTVYYQVENESDGEYPCLMATHWKLKPLTRAAP